MSRGAILLGAFLAGTAPAHAAPADSLAELWTMLGACARLDDVPASATGSEVTVLFSLKRDGSLLGRPRITHSRLVGQSGDQRAFMASALAAISRCLPMSISDGLGGAIAGRPLSFRMVSHRPERAL